MAIPTCAVLCIISDSVGGARVPGARVEARLSTYEVDDGEGYVSPRLVVGITDENGECTLMLWPNQAGSVESEYIIKITAPGQRTLKTTAVIPDDPSCNLWEVAGLPVYEGLDNGSLIIGQVFAARDAAIAAKDVAVQKAGEASTSASNALASEQAAATSETNAAASEAAAAASEQAAGTSETNAAASAAAAAASEGSAGGSASAAIAAANAAADSEAAAAASESNAATSEANAAASEATALSTLAVFASAAPASPLGGLRWTSAITGKTYEYIVDADSGQWVETGSAQAVSATAFAAALATAATLDAYGYTAQQVQDLFDNARTIQNYTALRNTSGRALAFRITTPGIDGDWVVDQIDTTSADDGGTILVRGDGKRVKRLVSGRLGFQVFEPTAGGIVDCSVKLSALAAAATRLGLPWEIPSGDYLIDGAAPIAFTTDVFCNGRLLIPKANKVCRIEFVRSDAGVVLDTSSWATLNRGVSAMAAVNAGSSKNIYMSSTQVLTERVANASYVRREMIRVRGPAGEATTPLVCTYDDKSKLTATAYWPSMPITVEDLVVVRTGADGGVETSIGSILIGRDNVTLNSPTIINDNVAEPLSVGILLSQCCDITINKPRCVGFNFSGSGYGILASSTIGVVINDAEMSDCRHALSGRHNVDLRINGGIWGNGIDDHWGDRMLVIGATIKATIGGAGVGFAGNDISLIDCAFIGGRSMLTNRDDTPHMGGRVIIKRPYWNTKGETGTVYGFGMSSPGGMSAAALSIMTQPISMPDYIEIDSPTIECDVSATVYLAWLGALKCVHTNWGAIAIKGVAKRVGPFTLIGVFATKNSTYQQGRALRVEVSGPMTLAATDRPIYLADEDGVATLGASVLIQGVNGGTPRFSPFSADSVQIIGGTVHSITNDKGAGLGTFATQRYTLSGVELAGGAIGVHSNIALRQCVFSGAYTNLPPLATGTYLGCVKTVAGNVGSINNITDNVVAPFSMPPSPSAVYNPPSLASGASTTTTVAATGAALGDFASASFSLDLQGIQLTAYVSAVNVVTVVLVNLTGGTIDLASGTLKVTLRKPS